MVLTDKAINKQLSLYPERCVGCRNCTMLCSRRHFDRFDTNLSAVTIFRFADEGANVPVMCLQCDDPKCAKACPTQALYRSLNGLVEMNAELCIGCKFCVQACPTGTASYASEYKRVLKCDLCGGDPLCAAWCPTHAIVYSEDPINISRRIAAAKSIKAADQKKEKCDEPCESSEISF